MTCFCTRQRANLGPKNTRQLSFHGRKWQVATGNFKPCYYRHVATEQHTPKIDHFHIADATNFSTMNEASTAKTKPLTFKLAASAMQKWSIGEFNACFYTSKTSSKFEAVM